MMRMRWVGGMLVGIGLMGLLGCGPSGAVVMGTVTLDGKPVDDGSITFEPADGQGASVGSTITAGKFQVDSTQGMLPGKKKVTIRASQKTGKQVAASPPAPAGTMVDEVRIFPPRGTAPPVESAEIKPGDNQLEFALQSKPTGKSK
ncbi:hypothetical protein [Tuwongella immobilis]|uniref:Carboxypeptidase regulatory-like domain-containing protein n=1 Tax=Tuwongella immobilis TaxID=692036 RepID=A0A6C2YK16_9BACT|nr:hypothetical protein [Tuwongella immobilis]VIP01717.1 Uncharacterized protein OS=Planctomyces maris DSM 8797 GN=PM8797T_14921 PE=4 SV=1 [Tuwongella immobilis]VTR99239.1 Uncharacterized protein OS=Planctomyces maris DSM 8797 GN=PM8797T_14921 PE=4 SV=1 [Tuwongella immobilis]